MRRLTTLLVIVLLPIASVFAAPRLAVLNVQNMTCSMCGVTVKKALQKLPGVEDITIDYGMKTATVKYDPAKVELTSMVKATTDAGFPSTLHK